jgi:hypothetical protein
MSTITPDDPLPRPVARHLPPSIIATYAAHGWHCDALRCRKAVAIETLRRYRWRGQVRMIEHFYCTGHGEEFATDPGACGYLADIEGPLGSHVTGIGDSPAAALASVWPLDLDDGQAAEDDEDQADDEDEPYCYTCAAPVGHFLGHGDGWHHWRGQGTVESPVELVDAGHAPEVAWRPAGAP